jgi:membrane dipeptidase
VVEAIAAVGHAGREGGLFPQGPALLREMQRVGMILDVTHLSDQYFDLETMVDHIDRVCQLAGNARHAAIGTDLDGGFGREQSPCDLDTIADLQRLPELLRKRGYPEEAIEGILYGNWVRFFREAWQ